MQVAQGQGLVRDCALVQAATVLFYDAPSTVILQQWPFDGFPTIMLPQQNFHDSASMTLLLAMVFQ